MKSNFTQQDDMEDESFWIASANTRIVPLTNNYFLEAQKDDPNIKNKTYWLGSVFSDGSRQLRYNLPIWLVIQIYLELIIVTFIGLLNLNFKNIYQGVSSVFAIFSILAVIVFTIWVPIFAIWSVPRWKIMGERFLNWFWPLFGDYKPGKLTLFYAFFILLRKFLYAICIVFLKDYPVA